MAFPPRYEPVPTVDKDNEEELRIHRRKRLGKKRFFFYLISFVALMVAACSAVRLARTRGFWMTCYGPRRNQSNLARLPSHYALPSGDKIPSVALGKMYCDVLVTTLRGSLRQYRCVASWKRRGWQCCQGRLIYARSLYDIEPPRLR